MTNMTFTIAGLQENSSSIRGNTSEFNNNPVIKPVNYNTWSVKNLLIKAMPLKPELNNSTELCGHVTCTPTKQPKMGTS